MKNKEVMQRIEQAHGFVSKMFWVATSLEDSDLKEFINEMDEDSFAKTFPTVLKSEYFSNYLGPEGEGLFQAIIDHELYGFVAEVQIPKCSHFSFLEETGKPIGWSVSTGVRRIEYVYAESVEELIDAVEVVSEKVFHEYAEKERPKIS